VVQQVSKKKNRKYSRHSRYSRVGDRSGPMMQAYYTSKFVADLKFYRKLRKQFKGMGEPCKTCKGVGEIIKPFYPYETRVCWACCGKGVIIPKN